MTLLLNLVNNKHLNHVIRKLSPKKYRVESQKGKNLGEYSSLQQAKKRLQQVELFKKLEKKS
jgi:hypothetical protein